MSGSAVGRNSNGDVTTSGNSTVIGMKKCDVDRKGYDPPLFWDKKVPDTELEKFKKIIQAKYNVHFGSYWEFHEWSVENYALLWEEIWNYFGVLTSKSYDEVFVKTGSGFLDNEWFRGALFNYAENILRIRDDSIALICVDELGSEETVTFAQMFEEVKLCAAAFRKLGLRKGDTVACYMSNIKEVVYIMLAATSIGAIWGGPLPYYGAAPALNTVKTMEPRFLFAVDHHLDNGAEYHTIDNLSIIAEGVSSLEKVVLVATKKETLAMDISNIRNCIYLHEFLEYGRTADGTVPDIVFEQLPFNHPICINFTSGTTGLPKGPVHSSGTFLANMRDYAFHLNLKRGDVLLNWYPVGWSVWQTFIPCLALGVKLLCYCGTPYYKRNDSDFWDIVSKYNASFAFLVTTMVDKMEKQKMIPGPGVNLDCLKVIGLGGNPVKLQNFEYLCKKVKKDLFVGNLYGSTEVFGAFSGFDLNSPSYSGEIQVPALGVNMKCFDAEGHSVVGQRGEVVVTTPTPSFPIYLWNDPNNSKMKETYLSKYPGVWCQNDECWINPKTKGFVVIGRSDDTLKQNGVRFSSADIYFAIHQMEELQDYICVSQDKENGDTRAVLFVKMSNGHSFTPELKKKIADTIRTEIWVDYVPEVILEAQDIPYNLNNKRMESVVRQILATNRIPEVMNIKNPESLKGFCNIPELKECNKK